MKYFREVKKLVEEQEYKILLDPETVEVSIGRQTFGSGGYTANWRRLYGEIQVLVTRPEKTQFIAATHKTIRRAPYCSQVTIVYCEESDRIGGIMRPRRIFKRVVAIWGL